MGGCVDSTPEPDSTTASRLRHLIALELIPVGQKTTKEIATTTRPAVFINAEVFLHRSREV